MCQPSAAAHAPVEEEKSSSPEEPPPRTSCLMKCCQGPVSRAARRKVPGGGRARRPARQTDSKKKKKTPHPTPRTLITSREALRQDNREPPPPMHSLPLNKTSHLLWTAMTTADELKWNRPDFKNNHREQAATKPHHRGLKWEGFSSLSTARLCKYFSPSFLFFFSLLGVCYSQLRRDDQ